MAEHGHNVELAFATKIARQLCENHSKARRFLGDIVAAQLRNRVADLEAATTVGDLVAGAPRVYDMNPPGQLALTLADPYFLFLAAADAPTPCGENGSVDWGRVTRVKILKIEKS